ncbi:MAG: pilus assembly protein PilM [Thermodesulfobacteriota bacterium]
MIEYKFLSRYEKISSTEKLLNLIRSDTSTADEPPDSEVPSFIKTFQANKAKIIPFQKGITVGVDIGDQDLKLAKVKQLSAHQWKLVNYMRVPFEPDLSPEKPEFHDLLRSTLYDFCSPSKKIRLWTSISSAHAGVHRILIPNVEKTKIADAVFWTSKEEITFNEKETILDYEVQGEVTEKGTKKIAAIVYTASKKEVEHIKTVFDDIGFPLTGITIAPLAYQNLFMARWLPVKEETLGSLSIGTDSSRIDIFRNGRLVFSRNLKIGLYSMCEALMKEYNKRKSREAPEISTEIEDINMPGQEKDALLKSIEELPAMSIEDAARVLLGLGPDAPSLTESDPGFELASEEIFEMIQPAVKRLTSQMEQTFNYYENVDNKRVTAIFISGGIDAYYKPFIDSIGAQCRINADIIDPFDEEDHFLDNMDLPGSVSKRISFIPAIGLALSDNSYTPNFLFTYKDKGRIVRIRRMNRIISAAFLCILAVCMGIFLWELHLADRKDARIARLDRELSQYIRKVDEKLIIQTAARVKTQQKRLKEYSEKYSCMSVLTDLSAMTPSDIRLLKVMANFGGTEKEKNNKDNSKSISIEGIVVGKQDTFDSSLAGYVMKLDSSPLFGPITIAKTNLEYYNKRQVLRFTLAIELV